LSLLPKLIQFSILQLNFFLLNNAQELLHN
jgi:hypothetical protein